MKYKVTLKPLYQASVRQMAVAGKIVVFRNGVARFVGEDVVEALRFRGEIFSVEREEDVVAEQEVVTGGTGAGEMQGAAAGSDVGPSLAANLDTDSDDGAGASGPGAGDENAEVLNADDGEKESSGADDDSTESPSAEDDSAESPSAEDDSAESPGAEDDSAESPSAKDDSAESPSAEDDSAESPSAGDENAEVLSVEGEGKESEADGAPAVGDEPSVPVPQTAAQRPETQDGKLTASEIMRLYDELKTWSRVAEYLGITTATLLQIRRALGLA